MQFEEIYSLEKETFECLKPVHGLIFLFKWVQDQSSKPQGNVVKDSRADEIFFPKQVWIQNIERPSQVDYKYGSDLPQSAPFS